MNVPITCLCGQNDPLVSADHMSYWHKYTISSFEMYEFPGDHFFVNRKDNTHPYIVVISCSGHDSETKALGHLKDKSRKMVVKSKTARKGSVELNVEIRLKDDNTDFINEIAAIEGVDSAVLVSYNGEYMG